MLHSPVRAGGRRLARVVAPFERLEDRTLLATVPSGFAYADFVTGLPECTSMTFAPDGRIFYTEKSGAVRVIKDGVKLSTPAVKVSVDGYFERGLQCITLDPQFATNGVFYLYYTKRPATSANTAPNDAKNRISRFQMNLSGNTDVVNPNVAEAVVLDNIPSDTGYHNGGAMVFDSNTAVAASQRLMYVGVGEVGLPNIADATDRAQDLSTLAGKVLRINPRAGAQLIPADNPFVGQSGKRGEIYSYGLRNPFTMAVKPGTNLVYANDVGSWLAEEVNQVKKGANYGFPRNEGYTTQAGYENPVHAYTHASTGHPNGQAAITGGTFYTASKFPSQFQGRYFFSDFTNKFIAFFDPANPPARGSTAPKFATGTDAIIDLDVGPDGNLYGLVHRVSSTPVAKIVKISYAGSANRNPEAVASADKTSGQLPLAVNFSGDGTTDPDGDTLTYSWTFGDGATATGKNVAHTYTTRGVYSARLTVTDGKGGSDDSDTITIDAGNQAPDVSITLPADGSLYSGGQTINFSGTATDPEDGTLPASRFDWRVTLFHDTHTHPFLDDSIDGVRSGSFTVPVDVETAPNQFYRIQLTVTDNNGLSKTTHVDIQPRTSTFTLDSNIDGITLNLDGQPRATPASILGVVGTRRRIEAPEFQTIDDVTYEFVEWSDGGARFHDISTPAADTTYTATYRVSTIQQAELRAAADAYVRDGSSANTNFGAAADLVVKRASGSGWTRESYLRFDIGDFDNIAGAALRVFGRTGSSTENIGVALFAASNVTWSETGLTWNNRPVTGTTQLAAVTASGTTGQWHEFDVGDYLRQQRAAGATAVTFVLKATGITEAQAMFHSDENAANKPLLIVRHAADAAQALVVSKSSLSVPEGGSASFTVRLASQPAADVVVTVAHQSGDTDLSASPVTLTFGADNWDTPQAVTVAAAADADTTNGSAVFGVSSPGLATKTLTATEQDDDAPPEPTEPVTLRAGADATVRDGAYAGNNYGAAVDLTVKKQSDPGYTREAYLRFDLSGVAAVGTARLRLFGRLTEAASVQAGVYAAPNASWTEGGITWNNRPASGATALATATLSGTSGAWLEWDLTAFLQAEKAAGRNLVTIVLKNLTITNAAALFASDEAAANRPELIIAPAAEPGGAVTRSTNTATHVRDGSSYGNTNFGNATELELKQASAGWARETWLKFDLSGLTTVSSGTLRLFGRINSTSESVGVGVFSSSNTTWSESTLTFNNRPATGSTALATKTVAGTTNEWYEWDLTGFLRAELSAGRTLVTLVLRPLAGTTATVVFNSDDATSNPPELLMNG